MKKVSIFLCMVLCSIALHANVVTGTCGDNLTWSYDTDTKALTIEGSGAMTDYDYWGNQPWAQVKGDILSVSLPEGLTSIGNYAFYLCSSLTSITLPNSVTSIGYKAFDNCSSLTSIILPNSVTSIGGDAFWNCYSLTSITIPNSVTSIGGRAFQYCSALTSVTLGNSVTSIEGDAFADCSALTSITIPNSVTSIGGNAFSSCAQVTVECTTPPTIAGGTFKSDASICIPCSALDTYLQAAIWQFLDLKGLSHTINLSATEGGKATITATDCDANTATIKAVADNLYQFSQWSDGNTDNPRTLTLTQDTTLQAKFGPSPSYSVTLRGNSILGYFQYFNEKGDIDKMWFNDGSEIIKITVPEGLSVYFYENNMECGTWLGWSDSVTENERTITITSDTVITSRFDVTTYQVSITAGENGSLSEEYNDVPLTDCDGQGETINICAYPDDGYYFAGWSDGNTERCRTFTITQDTTITALFEETKYYSVTLRGNSIVGRYQYINDWGDIIDSGFGYDSEINITVHEGSSVYFYEDNMYCGTWLGWSDGVTDNERTITITSDTVITSLFDVPTYQVNISAAEHGSLTQYGEPIGNIETTMTDCDSDGEWIEGVCAVPDEGYYFTGWSDGYADACRGIKVVSDTTLVAHFAEKHPVQVLVGVEPACKNMGTVSGSGIFYQGDVVTITATPNSGYHFVEWSDGNSIANREIYLTSDTTLFATFSAGDMGGKCGDNLYWTWDNGALT
ncbi:MAG: leucine-rich repeat protein, partial [Paludibacteraceae bacterium]